ncbi:MAG: PAS domain-containing protein [Candidatus Omnitrophota bacterium]
MILAGIGASIVLWLVESFVHVYVFNEGSALQQVFHPQVHETWMRLLAILIIFAFSFYAHKTVSKHKKMARKIRFAYAELNQIFNTAADGMCVIDKNFNILRANETFSKMAGIETKEIIGKKCYEIFFGERCHTPECSLRKISGGAGKYEKDVLKTTKTGVHISCIVTAMPFLDSEGKIEIESQKGQETSVYVNLPG